MSKSNPIVVGVIPPRCEVPVAELIREVKDKLPMDALLEKASSEIPMGDIMAKASAGFPLGAFTGKVASFLYSKPSVQVGLWGIALLVIAAGAGGAYFSFKANQRGSRAEENLKEMLAMLKKPPQEEEEEKKDADH